MNSVVTSHRDRASGLLRDRHDATNAQPGFDRRDTFLRPSAMTAPVPCDLVIARPARHRIGCTDDKPAG